MPKHLLKSLLLAVSLITVFAYTSAQKVQFTLVSSTPEEVVITANFPAFSTSQVEVNGEMMQTLTMKNAYPMLRAGFPELLGSSASIIIPKGSHPTAEILSSESCILSNFSLAPSKGNIYRNVDPATVPFTKGSVYSENRFLYEDTVVLGEPYLLRDYCGLAVQFFPFAYNPVQHELKAYSSITVKIRFNSRSSIIQPAKVAKTFKSIYSDHFLNYHSYRSTPLEEEGDMLILSPEEFCAAMQPYADWKNKTGYNTKIVSLDSVGTTSSVVKNYITNYYNTHNLVYVVLVGDNSKFPVIKTGGNTADNYYGEIVGSDHYPDIIIGKISAENVDQVNTQVERFLQYEQNPPETAHLPIFLGIASQEGGPSYGTEELDYEHIRDIDDVLSAYTYIHSSSYEVFEGSQGGLDQSGSTATQVTTALNNGVGIINYCGHGSETSWVTSGFNVSNINSLNNTNKLPFIISTACLNGDYVNRTCFAEAWMRATKNGQPTGAVSTLMSTISQSWVPPMCGQERMNDHLTGANGQDRLNTFGSIVFNGFYHLLDNYSDEYEVSQTWILFGDPALAVRTAVPEPLPLQYVEFSPMGVQNISFSSSVENAKVVLSKNGNIISSGYIENGSAILDVSSLPIRPDTLDVVAWAHNHIPFIGSLYRIATNGPYVICETISLRDDHNNIPESGDLMYVDLTAKNVGVQAAQTVRTRMYSNDPYVSFSGSTHTISTIPAGQSSTVTGAFSMQIAPNVPAFHIAPVFVEFVCNHDTTVSQQLIELCAPDVVVLNFVVDDAATGNHNNTFDYGETVELVFTLGNNGNANAPVGGLSLRSFDERLSLSTTEIPIPALTKNAITQVRVTASIDTSVNEPSMFGINTQYHAHPYFSNKIFRVKVGADVEDWESNSLDAHNWTSTGSNRWIITNQNAYEGNYAARSAQIGSNASSTLYITTSNELADSISFYYMVSSEQDFDFLHFYIDNVLQDSWSGSVSWTRASYPVPAGQHTYKWVYKKDMYMTEGQDMAMIDMVEFPCVNGPVSVESYQTADIQVRPNPATSWIQIVSDNNLSEQNAYFQLFDLSGRLLLQDGITDNIQTVDLNNFTSGLYILKVGSNNQTLKTFKIVKQ